MDSSQTAPLLECFTDPTVLIGLDYRILASNSHYRRVYGTPPPASPATSSPIAMPSPAIRPGRAVP